MTKEEYEDFALRYKGCGACFPMYQTLSRFEKMWFTAIQKDVVELEKACDKTQELLDKQIEATYKLDKENAELKEKLEVAEKARDYWKDSSFDWRHKCTSRKPFKVAVKAQKQFAKAKEKIRNLLEIIERPYQFNAPEKIQMVKEAEQFLNSEVEK